MKPSILLEKYRQEIRQIIEQNNTQNARVFGSVAQGLDSEESDLDILVDTTSETTLFDIGSIRHQLSQLLGSTRVDVITPEALPASFRHRVIAEAVVI